MHNLRKNRRFTCAVSVDSKEGSVFDQTKSVDFSKGGIGFISCHRIPVNKKIPMEIELSLEDKPVFVLGRVQWVRRLRNTKTYRIGITFLDIVNGSKLRFNQYFKNLKVT